ncbi:MAG: type II toxin-antitoxin system ParD family antitoxin [Candidatus Thiodiazotropha sp. L084R]
MATMNISLPEPLRDWVESQSKSGLYANNSDYVRALIRQDRKLQEKQQMLQAAISEGFASGDAGVLDINEIKAKARQQQQRSE